MDALGENELKRKYVSYFQMSKYLFIYGLIVFAYTLIIRDTSPTFLIFEITISSLNVLSLFVFLSVICGVLHYLLTANSPYKHQVNKFLSALPQKEVIFNYQFQLLITPHLVIILFFLV